MGEILELAREREVVLMCSEREACVAPHLLRPELQAHLWVIDGNNVYGSRPDGWWRNRAQAAERLTRSVAGWCASQGQRAILVFDGRPMTRVVEAAASAADRLRISFAGRPGRDAADDRIAELVEEKRAAEALTVVSADRGLVGRLPPGVVVEAPSRFLERLGIGPVRRSKRAR